MSNFIFLSSILFIIGSLGMFLVRKHIIIILISFELIVLAINMNFIFASIFLDDLTGQIFSILILTVAAAESAIGLALLIIYYRIRGGVSINLISLLKA